MHAEKFQVKFFAKNREVELEKLIPVFHNWIREKKIGDELLVDVADYAHVPQGPGVVLIGHQSDYYLDMAEDRPGLLYSRKRGFDGNVDARIEDAFTRALRACQLLEQEAGLGLKFAVDEALVRVQDRLNAPNTADAFDALRPAVEATAKKLLGAGSAIERVDDPKGPLTIRISGGDAADVGAALARA